MAVAIFSPDMTKVMVINDDEYVTFPVSEHCDLSQIKDDKDVPQKKELIGAYLLLKERQEILGYLVIADILDTVEYLAIVDFRVYLD